MNTCHSLSDKKTAVHRRLALLFISLGCTMAAPMAGAADSSPPAAASTVPIAADPAASDNALFDPPLLDDLNKPAAPATRSQNVTINLINLMVQRGLITKEDAAGLIRQAEQEAVEARAQAQKDAAAAVAAQAPAPPSDETVRVTYIPEIVRAQMRDEIKQEVMTQARDENWAAPRTLPDWLLRFRFMGDVRIRYEGDFYPAGNDNTGGFPNFNAINTGAPFDIAGNNFSPQYNVDQNRERFRLRARLGTEVDLGEGFTSGVRIATGENNAPVTENQSLGAANQGQGGNFSKYAIWLDRAFIKYEKNDFCITLGRFDNPFFTTSMIWANDLGFDGVMLKGKYEVAKGVKPFLTIGAFPVFNTDFNFASNQPAKFKSYDKYLYAGQLGADWKINKDFSTKVGVAYYLYQNIEGKLSDPFTPLLSADQGNTDDSRPAFSQNGNTYMALRNITPNALNNFGTTNQFQYFGLATPFHEFAVTGRLDYNHFEPLQVSLLGELVKNLAFDKNATGSKAVNNRGVTSSSGGSGPFSGGDTAWIVNLKVGKTALEKRWDWNVGASYRYVESDSVVDGFADADFGAPLTGTNLKGFTLGGSLALSSRVWLGLSWMSATSIAGPPYKNDLVQFDINVKF